MSFFNFIFRCISFIKRTFKIIFILDNTGIRNRKNIIQYSQVEIIDNIFALKTSHLVKTKIFAQKSLAIALNELMEIGKDFPQLIKLLFSNCFNHIFTITGMKEKTTTFSSAVFGQH
jgi:hypothetical protein